MGLMNGISAAAYTGGEIFARGALVDQQAAIQAERDKRLAEMQEQASIRGEQRGIQNRATERGLILDETVANAPKLRDVKAGDIKSEAMAKLDPEILALQNKAKTEALTAEEQAKLEFYEANKGKLLARKSAEAAAGRDPLSAKLHDIQIQAAQIELDYKKQETKLPPAVKARAESVRDEIKTISSAIAKAQAEGMFDANSDNAASLAKRYETLTGQLDKLLTPYYGDKAPKPAADQPKPSKGAATTEQIMGYAKRAGLSPQRAMEEARKSGYDVTGVQLPASREAGGLISQ